MGNEMQQNQPSSSVATIATEEARAMQEVQAAMVIAKKFPRDIRMAQDKIIAACTRPGLAESALYSYARGGTDITGPSIRLAETIAQCWGNLQFGIRELSQSNNESTVEAYAWDLESNTRQSKIFQVPHVRYTRNGSYDLKDPRDIYETVANNGARRLRACILGIIPGDVIEGAVRQCELTVKSSADTSPEGIKKLVEAFAKYEVTQTMIEKRIQCNLEAIKPAQVVMLRKIYTSLKDGMSSQIDWFDPEPNGQPGNTKTLPVLSTEQFEKELPTYKKAVEAGKKNVQDVITMLSSKYTLTDDQYTQLQDLAPTGQQ